MMLLIIISVAVTPVFERNDLKTDAVSAETVLLLSVCTAIVVCMAEVDVLMIRQIVHMP